MIRFICFANRGRCSTTSIPGTALRIGFRLGQKALGFRYLMDVIPLDAFLVRGSHGRLPDRPEQGPVLITNAPGLLPSGDVSATAVKDLLLSHLFDVAG